MDKEGVINRVRETIEGYLSSRGLELVELILRHEGGDFFLRILVDKPEGGISLGECASLNKEIGRILEENDTVQERYILEVSSPGLDRPLLTGADFRRSLNKSAKFFLRGMVEGKLEWDGLILSVDDFKVRIESAGRMLELPLQEIVKAKLLF